MKNILCYIFLLVFSFNTYGFELSSDTPFIKEAADQIDYLFNRNDEIEKTGSEETKWYIYFLGKNTETLKYIIEDSSYKTFSDNYLNQLNNLLTEINTSYGVVMYVGLTDYTKPIVLPFFPEGGTVLEKIEALRSRLDEVQNIQEASGSDINIGIEYLKKYKNTFGEIVDRIYEESVLPELGGKDYILPVSVYHNITVNEFSKNYHSIVVKRSAALKEKDTEFQVLRKSNTPPFGSTNDERMIANITDSYQKILSGNYELPIADVPIKKPFELTLCDYLPENNKVDEYGVTEAIKKLNTAYQRRNAINDTQTPRNKGDFYHLINVAGGDLSGKAEVIEDKLYLLKQKTGINFYVVFQPVATKMNIGAREEFAKQVLEGSALNGSSNTILITVPFLEVLPTANFTPLSCIQPGFVQSSSSLITSQGFKEASDLFNYVFEAYKEIEKPVYLVRYFESVSGELVRLEYSSSSNLKGLPYINAVRYYRSKYAGEKAELENTLSLLLSKEDVEHNSSLIIDYQNRINQKVEEGVLVENQIGYDIQNNIWQQEEAIVSQNVGLFREPYITNQDLVNQFIDKSSNDWAYGVKFDIVFNNGKLSKEHFYNIDNFSIVDPAVYGLIDVAGLIPGIDNFADPIGMLYAGYRDNSENIIAYSLASTITGAGAMYFKAGGEVFGVVAKLDDTGNLSYEVRTINGEIDENELQLTSSYVRQKDIAEEAFTEIQKQQNDEYIKTLILAKKGGLDNWFKFIDELSWDGATKAAFKKDFSDPATEVVEKFLKNPELFNAWKVLESNPILRKKPENLEYIRKWLKEGIEGKKLTDGISNSRSKQRLIDDIGTAKSKLHVRVLIKDYDNIPGIAKGRYMPNGSSLSDKLELPTGWSDDVDIPESQIRNFTGKIEPLELKPGDKIYRVSHANGASGPYWTRTKPDKLEDVIGGTAVLPEWNNFRYLYEYTIPDGVTVKSWKGKTARQPVSYKDDGNPLPSNYHLPGGDEQLFISFIGKQNINFNTLIKTTEITW